MENAINPTYIPAAKRNVVFNEDWVVVILGFLIIILALAGVRPLTPVYNWTNGNDLLGKVFTSSNVILIAIQFLFVFVIALLGSVFTGKSLKSYMIVFPVVYIITIVAVILAGNKQVKALNLEAVIFSLSIGLIIGNIFKLPE